MEEIKTFFFDTYALYEILHENKSYSPFVKDINIVTTKLNLMELYYRLLQLYGKETADKAYDRFQEFCIGYDEILKEASIFRLQFYRRDLSYIDCIGYILAKKRNVKFLTGDEQFKDMDNVEFVK